MVEYEETARRTVPPHDNQLKVDQIVAASLPRKGYMLAHARGGNATNTAESPMLQWHHLVFLAMADRLSRLSFESSMASVCTRSIP
jgi:hypothetical protein